MKSFSTRSLIVTFILILFSINANYAQVGIGTTTPKSSLQVEGNPGDTTTPDGIQVPSLTITQLEGKIIGGAYGADQDGAIVYISDASIGSSISETADIKNKGFYYYFHNGVSGIWRVIGEQKIDLTNPDRVPRWDGTNLIEGSIIDSGGNIGIGTLTPDALLDVEGSFQIKDGSQGEGKYLTSDADGNTSWRTIMPTDVFNSFIPQDFSCFASSGSLFLATLGGIPVALDVQDNYAFALDNLRLNVINIEDKTNPTLSGDISLSGFGNVAADGIYAYVVGPDFRIIDVSNPASPTQLGVLTISSFVKPVINGNIAYVVDTATNELKVLDITSKTNPLINPASTLALGTGSPNSMTRVGDRLYIVSYASTDLKIIDISDPLAPSLIGSFVTGNIMQDHASRGNFVYVADSTNEVMQIYDVSNPLNPVARGFVSSGANSFPYRLDVQGNYVYLSDSTWNKLFIINVEDPDNPVIEEEIVSVNLDFPVGLNIQDNFAFTVDQNSKNFEIFQLTCSSSSSSSSFISINQFTGEATSMQESDPTVNMTTSDVIPKWDGSNLIDGTIVDSGGNVGIGITPTSNKFEVDGDVRFSSATNTTLTVQSPDNSISLIRAFGNNQGSGAIEVGQANTYGGGISYNGDLNPSFVANERMDHVTFYRQNNGVRSAVFDYSYANDNVNFNGNIITSLLSTGHGFNELYAMDQNVRTTDAVSFNGGISWNSGVNNINDVTGSFGSVQVNGGGASGWEGFSINGRVVFMHDGGNTVGIYDDVNNNWLLNSQFNGGTYLYYNGSSKLYTNNDGVFVSGRINTGPGATEVYQMNQNVRTTDAVSFGTVNTGQGANELYDMNQNVLTNSNVTFNDINVSSDLDVFGASSTTSVSGQTAMYEQIRIFHPQNTAYRWSIGHQAAAPSTTDDDLYFYVNKNGTQNVAGVILDQNPTTTMNFTGQHRTLVDGVDYQNKNETESLIGLIVVADNNEYLNISGGLTEGQGAITIDEALPIVSLSSKEKDKSVFGVISSLESEERQDNAGAFATPYEKEKGDERFYINSVGEGGIWIVDMGQTLESGDFIQTSNVKGYGMRQDDDLLHNYTVAKITMDCDFEPELRMKRQIKRIANEDGSYENVLDQFGRVEWEPMLDETGQVIMELPYKMRYLNEDGDTITKEDYNQLIQDGKKAYRAAFVGCTYHCG